MRRLWSVVTGSMMCLGLSVFGQQPAPAGQPAAPAPAPASATNLGSDANGNPLRKAKTGHVSNYDESKVPPYTLPDPLVNANGTRVADARAWRTQRRPEILKLYENEVFGRIPANAPKVKWAVAETDPAARGGTVMTKKVVGTIGPAADGPRINVTVHTPASARGPVPLILLVNFGGG
ncbi:MAG: acetylxylan esterase, partial [Acidobacteriota bacterium]